MATLSTCLTQRFSRNTAFSTRAPWICSLLTCVLATNVIAQKSSQIVDDGGIDWVMFKDPELADRDETYDVSSAPLPIWQKALQQPDPMLLRQTIDSISQAHALNMKGVETLVPQIVALAKKPQQNLSVRLAAVRTLTTMNVREQAPLLAALARRHGESVSRIVEPALARWGSLEMEKDWTQRLQASLPGVVQGGPRPRKSAIRAAIAGLANSDNPAIQDDLWQLASHPSIKLDIRVMAAESLGKSNSQGLGDRTTQLLSSQQRSLAAQLVALKLLQKHTDQRAIDTLVSLTKSNVSAVQAAALERLFQIDPKLVDPLADDAIISEDVNVRKMGARALFATRNAVRIAPLASLLDDRNPSLRHKVAFWLLQLAESPTLKQEVIKRSVNVLSQDSWRGCEKAAVVLVHLDHKPCSDRLVELMNHPRAETMVAAAWGLRKLALEKHLPEMLDQAKATYSGFKQKKLSLRQNPGHEQQIAQLFTAFGQMRYQAADALMREYVPKNFDLGYFARPAAVWALGYLHEDKAPEDLTKSLIERLQDTDSMFPEVPDVRRCAAVTLGRMKSKSAVAVLEKYCRIPNKTGQACCWSLNRMTGREIPVLPPIVHKFDEWFLRPISTSEPD